MQQTLETLESVTAVKRTMRESSNAPRMTLEATECYEVPGTRNTEGSSAGRRTVDEILLAYSDTRSVVLATPEVARVLIHSNLVFNKVRLRYRHGDQ